MYPLEPVSHLMELSQKRANVLYYPKPYLTKYCFRHEYEWDDQLSNSTQVPLTCKSFKFLWTKESYTIANAQCLQTALSLIQDKCNHRQ